MALLIGEPGMRFRCREYTCVLNNCFNVVLYSGCTAVCGDSTGEVGFVVPVHYLSFIKTIDGSYGLQSDPAAIFSFETPDGAARLAEFVKTQAGCLEYAILPEFSPSGPKTAAAGRPGKATPGRPKRGLSKRESL